MNLEDKIWLAGLFDASASFNIRMDIDSNSFSPFIGIYGMTKEVADRFYKVLYDEFAYTNKVRKPKKKGNFFYIELYATLIRKVIPEIAVYMTRVQNVDDIVESCNVTGEEKVSGRKGMIGRLPYSDNEIEKLVILKHRMARRSKRMDEQAPYHIEHTDSLQ